MLMFTVLVCSCGPSQEEFDELKQQKERLSEEVEELNNIVRFVDGDVTRIYDEGKWRDIWYLWGKYELNEKHKNDTECYYDATINLPYPLSCQLPPKGTRNPKLRTLQEIGYGKTIEEQKLDYAD